MRPNKAFSHSLYDKRNGPIKRLPGARSSQSSTEVILKRKARRGEARRLARLCGTQRPYCPITLLDKIVELKREEQPTIERLMAEFPQLGANEWIIRYGSTQEWADIAARYETPALDWIIRVLIVAQRDLNWLGGSVAAPIWLFRAYIDRSDGDAERLARWAVANRGRNEYIPFGSAWGSSLEEWRKWKVDGPRRIAEKRREEQAHREAKVLRLQERQRAHEQRRRAAKSRGKAIAAVLERLERMSPLERLGVVASDRSLPLGALPPALIRSLLGAAAELDADTRAALLGRIDRRRSNGWAQLRSRVEEVNGSAINRAHGAENS